VTPRPGPHPPLEFEWAGRTRTIACHSSNIDGNQVPNSLAAVEACLSLGAPRIEVDLRILADGTLVSFHDADLSPLTDRAGRLENLDWEDVRFARLVSNPELVIPRFEEVIDRVKGSKTVLHVDLKPMSLLAETHLDAIAEALAPVHDHVFVGSQASWTLDGIASRGLRTAFDPFRHFHRWPDRPAGETQIPRGQSLHGLWDDALCGLVPNMPAVDYAALRVRELTRLVPSASEWMVEKSTVRHLANLGFSLGDALHERGIALSAWTLQDSGSEANHRQLAELFSLGVDVIIADNALAFGYAMAGESVRPNL
jgi:glycerophosphoryl diester phosphodiesterase